MKVQIVNNVAETNLKEQLKIEFDQADDIRIATGYVGVSIIEFLHLFLRVFKEWRKSKVNYRYGFFGKA